MRSPLKSSVPSSLPLAAAHLWWGLGHGCSGCLSCGCCVHICTCAGNHGRRYHPAHIVVTENGVSVPSEQTMRVEDATKDAFRVNFYR